MDVKLDVLSADTLRDLHGLDPNRESGLLIRLTEKFVSQSNRDIGGLDEAIKGLVYEKVRHHAHSLKSSCSSLGALSMAVTCNHLEQAALNKELEDAPLLLEQIRSECARVEHALRIECS